MFAREGGGMVTNIAVDNKEIEDENKRKHARLDIALTVSYAIKNHDGNEVSELAEALSSDISAGGLRLMTTSKLKSGDLIDLEITINGCEDEPIKADGEVVWQSQLSKSSFETGAVIKYMAESDKQRFMGFIFDQMSRVVGATQSSPH